MNNLSIGDTGSSKDFSFTAHAVNSFGVRNAGTEKVEGAPNGVEDSEKSAFNEVKEATLTNLLRIPYTAIKRVSLNHVVALPPLLSSLWFSLLLFPTLVKPLSLSRIGSLSFSKNNRGSQEAIACKTYYLCIGMLSYQTWVQRLRDRWLLHWNLYLPYPANLSIVISKVPQKHGTSLIPAPHSMPIRSSQRTCTRDAVRDCTSFIKS
jgi:hypothetical protein